MNARHTNGHIAELKASLWYVENGYEIYWPGLTQSSIDFIAVRDDLIERVQVKKAYWFTRPAGTTYLQVTTRKGCGSQLKQSYTKKDCDTIFIVADEGYWKMPVEELNGTTNLVLAKGQNIRKRGSSVYDIDKWKIT